MSNNKDRQIPEHLFVKNPISGNLVNLMPLFEMMSEDGVIDGPNRLIERIQEIHDFISTNVPKMKGCSVNAHEWADANFWLVQFRKTFERMREVSP